MPKRIPRPGLPVNLTREKWRPSIERQAQMDEYLWDREIMRVYCDCSLSQRLNAYGIAASFVFDGTVTVRSRKVYGRPSQLHSTFGELQAILYAIQQAGTVLPTCAHDPSNIIVFSDVSSIDHLMTSAEDIAFGAPVQRIDVAKSSFTEKWATLGFEIRYLPPEEQRHNPFYASAHNAARREVSNGARSSKVGRK